ncbi:helix-turn-helix domain-containing protein [Ruegeria atlantica]|uniref:helix-turn-helix domain-containing protein n=1 Tax=Ruegeria atlantica TaxID=81569 RepID=UPI0011AE1F51
MRWHRAESLSAIGRLCSRGSSPLSPPLAPPGRIRPPARVRSRRALTRCDREEISRGLRARVSIRSIARALNRSPSSVRQCTKS